MGYIYLFQLKFLFSLINTQIWNWWIIWQLYFNFLKKLHTFPIVTAPIYNSTSSVQVFPFIHILTNTPYLLSFWWQPFCHYGFHLQFSEDFWCWISYHVPVGQLYVFFRKMSIQAHYSTGWFLLLSYMSDLYILDINPISCVLFENDFSSLVSCLFTLLMVSFAVQKAKFAVFTFIYFFISFV